LSDVQDATILPHPNQEPPLFSPYLAMHPRPDSLCSLLFLPVVAFKHRPLPHCTFPPFSVLPDIKVLVSSPCLAANILAFIAEALTKSVPCFCSSNSIRCAPLLQPLLRSLITTPSAIGSCKFSTDFCGCVLFPGNPVSLKFIRPSYKRVFDVMGTFQPDESPIPCPFVSEPLPHVCLIRDFFCAPSTTSPNRSAFRLSFTNFFTSLSLRRTHHTLSLPPPPFCLLKMRFLSPFSIHVGICLQPHLRWTNSIPMFRCFRKHLNSLDRPRGPV